MAEAVNWEEFFDSKFPKGAWATLATGDPAVSDVDESPQILVSGFGVDAYDDEHPSLFLKNYFTGTPVIFTLERVVEDEAGRMVVATDSGRFIVLSDKISDEHAEMIQQRKEGGIFS